MSNEEVIELQELRKEKDIQSRKVQSLQFEVEDNEMALEALLSWKRLRWIGFLIALIAFATILMFAYLHLKNIEETDSGLYQNFSDTVLSSISTVSIAFALMLLIAMAIICVVLGMKLFMELGDSDAARLMAKAHSTRNYHIELEKITDRMKILKRSLYEEEVKLKFMLPRLNELEEKEESWN